MTKTELKEWMWRWLSPYADQYKFMDEFDAKLDKYAEIKAEKLPISGVRFQLPSDKQMIELAILFNDGKLEPEKLSDMVAYGQFIVDRLYENGDVVTPSSKEEGN